MSAPVEAPWQRLDPRKLLLDPVKVVGQFAVPAVVAFIGISSREDGMPWWAVPIGVVGAVVLGALPWLTTTYRLTATQFQVRSGIVNKKTSTAPLDRVRSVDLEASLLHRVLGLARVQVGTGVDEDRITLDAISRDAAAQLRGTLLARGRTAATTGPAPDPAHPDPAGAPPAVPLTPEAAEPVEVLATIDWSWLRFAPFSLSRLVLVAGAVGVLFQFGENLPFVDEESLTTAWQWVRGIALALVVLVTLVSGLVGWVLVAVTGYVVQWWDLRLTRDHGSLHQTAGLFTTRSITVEEKRVRGVELTEPVLLRAVGGAQLATLATGVGAGGVTQVLPPCPRTVATGVGDRILTSPEPLSVPLTGHGPAARRRRWVRKVRVALLVPAATVWPVVHFGLPWWLPVVVGVVAVLLGGLVAESAYRHLGHAATAEHLVVGGGDLTRVRTVLELDGIIGWVVRETWFQRRVGVANLVATTAAGAERVVARDIPVGRAVALADAATPGVLTPFLA